MQKRNGKRKGRRAPRRASRQAASRSRKSVVRRSAFTKRSPVNPSDATFAPVAMASSVPIGSLGMQASPDGLQVRVHGSVAFGPLTKGATGNLIRSIPLNPIMWPDTRLSALARLYEKWRIVSLRVRYMAGCPTTTTGTVCTFIDYDPDDVDVIDSQTDFTRAADNVGAVVHSTWTNAVVDWRPRMKGDNLWRWVDADGASSRTVSEGTVYFIGSASSGTIEYGWAHLEFVLEFCTPDVPNINSKVLGPAITETLTCATNPAGVAALFTVGATPAGTEVDDTFLITLPNSAILSTGLDVPLQSNQPLFAKFISAASGYYHLYLNAASLLADKMLSVHTTIAAPFTVATGAILRKIQTSSGNFDV